MTDDELAAEGVLGCHYAEAKAVKDRLRSRVEKDRLRSRVERLQRGLVGIERRVRKLAHDPAFLGPIPARAPELRDQLMLCVRAVEEAEHRLQRVLLLTCP